jgi:hypothetical protein
LIQGSGCLSLSVRRRIMNHHYSFLDRNRVLASFLVTVLLLAVGGCASWKGQQGVINKWRDESVPPFEKGLTTQSNVVKLLGPPSQVIGLNDGVVFYYMLEKTIGKGLFLIIYNTRDITVRYDRAIFFFDENGVLTDYGYSIESAPYEEAP